MPQETNIPVIIPEPYRPQPTVPWELDQQEASVPLAHYLWILRRHRWRIIGFIAFAVVATLLVSLRLTPVYESTTTIDVDRKMPTGILGAEAAQSALTLNDADQFLATQVKLIQSDSVLRPVADQYNLLALESKQDYGAKEEAAPETPVILKNLKVTRPPNTYILQIAYRSPDRKLAAEVANSIADSYINHTYRIRYTASAGLSKFMEKQIEELKAKMERSSSALVQFERELNVINPEEKTNIISARLLQLNSEYTSAQGARVSKEAAWLSVKDGSADAAQASTQGEDLRKLTETVNDMQQKFAEAKTHYGPNHQEYKRLQAQLDEAQAQLKSTRESIRKRVEIEYTQAQQREKMLEAAVAETKTEFDHINARSFEYQTLKREAEADKTLYEELVRKIKEAGINASFQNSSIRVADPARPGRSPVFPNLRLNLLLAFLLSSLVALGVAFVADVLDDTIRDPEQVIRSLRSQVLGTLPQVKEWRGRPGSISFGAPALLPINGNGNGNGPSPERMHLTSYEEAIRTLRNSILLTDFSREIKTLLVTSASPSEGKSTLAIHLAIAHAQQHHRTLIIDGDLRRPSIHKRFGLHNTIGLSNVLVNDFPWREAVLTVDGLPELDVLPAGSVSRKAADLMGQTLPRLLEEASEEYSLILLDAPPLLGFPEPLLMATAADGVVIVSRAGQTSRKGVSSVLATLTRLRANVLGLVLNEVHREVSDHYYYYGYYGKYYKHYNREAS